MDERASWPPKRSEAEQRRRDAALLYDLEIEYRKIAAGEEVGDKHARKEDARENQ